MQNPGKAVQIKDVGAGQHRKIGLRPAGHTLKRLRKGSAEHGIRSGGAQLLSKFLPIIYGEHWYARSFACFTRAAAT